MTKQAAGLVKPYWVRVGSGGLPIKSERDVVRFFFDKDLDDRSLELVTINKFGSSKSPPPYWTPEIVASIAQAGGLLLIPGDWPEPSGPVYEHMVPFKPEITPCEAGQTEAKTDYVYVVQEGESPSDVAIRFGQPYDGWVALRQANHDDPGGFTKPAADNGACTFAQWGPGKRVKVPAKWPDPPKSNQIWQNIEQFTLGSGPQGPGPDPFKVIEAVFEDRMQGVLAAPRKDETMSVRPYIVQTGDTPGTLAGRHGVDKEEIFRINPKLTVVTDRHGDRNFYQTHFRVGQRINVPGSTGSVGEPSGNVGCGAGGGNPFVPGDMGYYSQAPCSQCGACSGPCGCTDTGNVGAMPVLRRVPQVPLLHRRTVVVNPWDAKHPAWGGGSQGSNLMYWATRIEHIIAHLALNQANPGLASKFLGCYQNIQTGDGRARLHAWLRTFAGPWALVEAFPAHPSRSKSGSAPYLVIPVQPPGVWFATYTDPHTATQAAFYFNDRFCTSVAGTMHGPQGAVGAPGQVGCGSGGCGGSYGMAQFGGVAGFNRMVARSGGPQVQQQPRRQVMRTAHAPSVAGGYAWNTQYWEIRIHASIAASTSQPGWYNHCAQRFTPTGGGFAALSNWLHSFPSEEAFKHKFAWPDPNVTAIIPPGTVFNDPGDRSIVQRAAQEFSRTACVLPGAVGAPSGTVGATGDVCTPYGAAVTKVKDYYYIVQKDDLDSFWKIPGKFNMPTYKEFWQQLRNANMDWVGGLHENSYGDCVLRGLYTGAKLKVPASWLDPKPGVTTEPIGGTETCGTGQIEMGGQCVDLPPGVTVPTNGSCPAGTTNVGGLCIPTGGYTPPPGQACLPGTTMGTNGKCQIPGGGPGPVIPGVPPVGGVCPASMTKHSDGLCYAPGTAPPGITPVGLTTGKSEEDEGYPTWAWALLGLGAVAGVAGVAYYAKKKKEEQGGDESLDEEIDEEEEVVVET
jgi:LysM domain